MARLERLTVYPVKGLDGIDGEIPDGDAAGSQTGFDGNLSQTLHVSDRVKSEA